MEGKPPVTPTPPPTQQQHTPPRVSRFRRLLLRVSASVRLAGDGKERVEKEGEKVSALDRMVLSFMEDSAAVERPQRGRCNCFNGSNFFLPSDHSASAGDTLDSLKGLVQSASVTERNLLADASRIAERSGKSYKGKAEYRRAVADGLRALGYDAAVCRSRWEKTSSYPAGEHEYIDALPPLFVGGGLVAGAARYGVRLAAVAGEELVGEGDHVGADRRAEDLRHLYAGGVRRHLALQGLHGHQGTRGGGYFRRRWRGG
uniref:Uncharacterized protein n=1 Tax=Oryza punctata TaxID=4537 RepID=A0A0E0MGG3_ORYPU